MKTTLQTLRAFFLREDVLSVGVCLLMASIMHASHGHDAWIMRVLVSFVEVALLSVAFYVVLSQTVRWISSRLPVWQAIHFGALPRVKTLRGSMRPYIQHLRGVDWFRRDVKIAISVFLLMVFIGGGLAFSLSRVSWKPAPSVVQDAPSEEPPRPRKKFQAIRKSKYDQLILFYSKRYQLDPALLKAVVHRESSFNPNARSPKGARGLMQLMPGTAADMGVKNVLDPQQNIAGGARYLREQINQFGDVKIALAAYNAGPENVKRYGGNIPPFRETREYVQDILHLQGLYSKAR